MKKNETRGGAGMIVMLIVLVVVAFLVMKNFQKLGVGGGVDVSGSGEKMSVNAILDKFKGDAKRLQDAGDLQNLQNENNK